MKKNSTKTVDLDIPELTREQLGKGVRGKYFKQFRESSNVVVLRPELSKAFPNSAAVNDALASMLAFAKHTQGLTAHSGRAVRKQATV